MICEIVAMTCLLCHGDIAITQDARFAPKLPIEQLMALFDKLDGKFFPQPLGHTRHDEADSRRPPRMGAAFSKIDLLKLKSRCDSIVHRTDLENPFSRISFDGVHDSELRGWRAKLHYLLDSHKMETVDGHLFITCHMATAVEFNKVSVHWDG
jgi:hypothetical protein